MGVLLFSLSMVSHETRGISSSTEHLVSTYCVPNTVSAGNREMKSSVFPKERLVWGRQILNKNSKAQ